MIEWIADVMPLAAAATDDPGLLSSLFYKFALAARIALGIGLVIFVHELGHFVAAKTFGVKCEKFYVGFDVPLRLGPIKFPRTLGKFRYGETEYGIGVIPLGGYVKMLGQDDDPRKQEEEAKRIQVEGEDDAEAETPTFDPRSFPAKPVWQRMIIISAGVIMNVITGVLFAALAFGYGVEYNPAVIGAVTPGGPAWQAGIEPGGKVISVGSWSDQEMHFLEMRKEILTRGLEQPTAPIALGVSYADGDKNFSLTTQASPLQKEARLIGIAIPNSPFLGNNPGAIPNSAAAGVFTEKDAGAEILSFNGTKINPDSNVPVTPLLHQLYTHPSEPLSLKLRQTNGDLLTVTVPAQKSKSLGFRYAIGPVIALVKDGPAEQAGMQVGDIIQSIDGNADLGAYALAETLVGINQPIKVMVQRGDEESLEEIALTIKPSDSPQTLSPTSSILGEIAVNSVGFAYKPLPVITSILGSDAEAEESAEQPEDSLQVGDELRWISLDAETAKSLIPEDGDERIAALLQQLVERWEISDTMPLNNLRDLIQLLPEGTKLTAAARRGEDDLVIKSEIQVVSDELFMFDRGLLLGQRQAVQKATSVTMALSLGMREGVRRFNDVVRFLKMIPQGQIKLRHVGGPLEIVNIAKNEAEKGFSRQLMFLTMLSMNLAILNFLPIPALDGGHMVFLIYELVAGKRANETLEFRLTVAGLLALLTLMAVVFANDILRYL
ncbi:site-2 protease family protein [bacterium]|nr:site-2 protease family protein [bacterium]